MPFVPMMIGLGVDGQTTMIPPDEVQAGKPFLTKLHMEFAHLQHFKALVGSQLHAMRFRLVQQGADPPDFLLARDGVPFGLELTVLVASQRRERVAFIAKLHDRLLSEYEKGRLRGLSGIKVDLSFGELGAKPFKMSDSQFEKLAQAFDELGQKARPSMAAGVDIPNEEWPQGQVDTINWAVSSFAEFPFTGSALANATGFEVEYTHRQQATPADIEAAINERIEEKDKQGAWPSELLIVAGAPDRMGRAFPAEAMLAHQLLENHSPSFVKPAHLRRVFVDVWGVNRVYLIFDAMAATIGG